MENVSAQNVSALSTAVAGSTALSRTEQQDVQPPHSIPAEQGVLGALMFNNKQLDDIAGKLEATHFYVPFHAEVFKVIENLVNKGFEATPVLVVEKLKGSTFAADKDFNLNQHLLDMMENGQYVQDVRGLAEQIHGYYLRRSLMQVGTRLWQDALQTEQLEETHTLLEGASSELFALTESGSGRVQITSLHQPLRVVLQNAEDAQKHGTGVVGVPSGFGELDKKLGGFQNSDLIILAARPAMGKTAFALNVLEHIASEKRRNKQGGQPVGIFSLEMSADQFASRLLSSSSGIDSRKIMTGDLTDGEWGTLQSAAAELSETPFFIDDTPSLTLNVLRARARRMKQQYDIGILVVDYLQLLRGSARSQENRVQEISEISMGLKSIAKEMNVPVVALSQLSRAVEQRDNKRPQLSDLRESGSIEQDADIVMFLYREEYYLKQKMGVMETSEGLATIDGDKDQQEQFKLRERLEKVAGKAELIISKNRKGAVGSIPLKFEEQITRFYSLDLHH